MALEEASQCRSSEPISAELQGSWPTATARQTYYGRNQEQNKGDEEYDLGDFNRRTCNAAKAQQTRDQRDNQKCNHPTHHGSLLFLFEPTLSFKTNSAQAQKFLPPVATKAEDSGVGQTKAAIALGLGGVILAKANLSGGTNRAYISDNPDMQAPLPGLTVSSWAQRRII